MTKKYNSKLDPTIIIPIFLMLITIEVLMLLNRIWEGVLFISFLTVLLIYLFQSTYYMLTDDNKLVVKAGFLFNKTIEVSSIKKIASTKSSIASPALSFDRLLISFNEYDTVIISPKNKKEFIEELRRINPAIVVE